MIYEVNLIFKRYRKYQKLIDHQKIQIKRIQIQGFIDNHNIKQKRNIITEIIKKIIMLMKNRKLKREIKEKYTIMKI